jgi:hypothetical protein
MVQTLAAFYQDLVNVLGISKGEVQREPKTEDSSRREK